MNMILANIFINFFQMYENVFVPSVGPSLAFIGFVQPASGGVLSMSEVQARWFSAICAGKVSQVKTVPGRSREDLEDHCVSLFFVV